MAPSRRQYGKERSLFIKRAPSAFAASKSISSGARNSSATRALSKEKHPGWNRFVAEIKEFLKQ